MQNKDTNLTAFGVATGQGYLIVAICFAILLLLRILYREFEFEHIYRYYAVSLIFFLCTAITTTLSLNSIEEQCNYFKERRMKVGPFLYSVSKIFAPVLLCVYILIVFKVGFTVIVDEFFDEISFRGLLTLCVFVTFLPILLVPYICDFMPAKKNDISDI